MSEGDKTQAGRGRSAERPAEIPRRGWWDVLRRIQRELTSDPVTLIAGGLAFFAMLAIFPALVAAVAIFGLFGDVTLIWRYGDDFAGWIPRDALDLIIEQLTQISDEKDTTLGVGLLVSVMLSLWSARKGMAALIQACNLAYDEADKRGFLKNLVLSLAFTLGGVISLLAMLSLGLILPVVLDALRLGDVTTELLRIGRWLLLWLYGILVLALVYRYAPSRATARWVWVSWGAVWASTFWLLGSAAFSLYVGQWADFSGSYGALGGVVVLLMWLYLSALVIILGAEINAEIEHQTARDSTTGSPQPMGSRGAHVADTLGARAGGENDEPAADEEDGGLERLKEDGPDDKA